MHFLLHFFDAVGQVVLVYGVEDGVQPCRRAFQVNVWRGIVGLLRVEWGEVLFILPFRYLRGGSFRYLVEVGRRWYLSLTYLRGTFSVHEWLFAKCNDERQLPFSLRRFHFRCPIRDRVLASGDLFGGDVRTIVSCVHGLRRVFVRQVFRSVREIACQEVSDPRGGDSVLAVCLIERVFIHRQVGEGMASMAFLVPASGLSPISPIDRAIFRVRD